MGVILVGILAMVFIIWFVPAIRKFPWSSSDRSIRFLF